MCAFKRLKDREEKYLVMRVVPTSSTVFCLDLSSHRFPAQAVEQFRPRPSVKVREGGKWWTISLAREWSRTIIWEGER